MQLCTNARVFLDLVAASGEPKLWDLTPAEARKKVIELTRIQELFSAARAKGRGQLDHFRSAFICLQRPTTSRQVA